VVEGRRLDAMQTAVWDAASGGDTDAIRAVLGIMARRAKLFALDAPQRLAVGISETEFARRNRRGRRWTAYRNTPMTADERLTQPRTSAVRGWPHWLSSGGKSQCSWTGFLARTS
jgi:hypothetical protein